MPNIVFEADAARQRIVPCWVCAPRGSTQRYAPREDLL